MRLLSCETSQLASLIDVERRHGARRRGRLGGSVLSSDSEDLGDDEAGTAVAVVDEDGDNDVSTQKVLLSAVIDELKSVSMMMSSTLETVTASGATPSSIPTAQHRADKNTTTTASSHDEHSKCLSAAATDDDADDADDDYNDNDRKDDTCTTEVSAAYFSVNGCMPYFYSSRAAFLT